MKLATSKFVHDRAPNVMSGINGRRLRKQKKLPPLPRERYGGNEALGRLMQRLSEAKRRPLKARSGRPGTRRRRGTERQERARLGNTRIALHPSSRERRYALREGLSQLSNLPRVCKCGNVTVAPTVSIRAGQDGSGAGFAGLLTCGSVWACPVCSAKISARRSEELTAVIEQAEKDGYKTSLLTLTMRHHKGQKLADLWGALSYAWGAITSGKKWLKIGENIGLIGWARAVEVTHGKNGWHVHVHALFISEKDPTRDVDAVAYMVKRWGDALAKRGIDMLADHGGFDWQCANPGEAEALGSYVAKMGGSGLAKEATLGAFKLARGKNRTPFQILSDVLELGDADDLDVWHEYERVSKGKRALTWSKTLREYSKIQEVSDEEIASEEVGDDAVAVIDASDWKDVRRHAPRLLDVCEAEGVHALWRLLDDLGVPWRLPQTGRWCDENLNSEDRLALLKT